MNLSRKEFEKILQEILGDLPEDILEKLKDVPIFIEDEDADAEDAGEALGVLEEENELKRIVLFRKAILEEAGKNKKNIRKEIEKTLLHEIGHLFGLEEEDLERIGLG